MDNFSTDGSRIPMLIGGIEFEIDIQGYDEDEGTLEIEYFYTGELREPVEYYEQKIQEKINLALEVAIEKHKRGFYGSKTEL